MINVTEMPGMMLVRHWHLFSRASSISPLPVSGVIVIPRNGCCHFISHTVVVVTIIIQSEYWWYYISALLLRVIKRVDIRLVMRGCIEQRKGRHCSLVQWKLFQRFLEIVLLVWCKVCSWFLLLKISRYWSASIFLLLVHPRDRLMIGEPLEITHCPNFCKITTILKVLWTILLLMLTIFINHLLIALS